MLDQATATLKDGEHPVVHTDRGCHYRWPGWISRATEAGLQRSMSKKGCSPDNAACEGFFGRIDIGQGVDVFTVYDGNAVEMDVEGIMDMNYSNFCQSSKTKVVYIYI